MARSMTAGQVVSVEHRRKPLRRQDGKPGRERSGLPMHGDSRERGREKKRGRGGGRRAASKPKEERQRCNNVDQLGGRARWKGDQARMFGWGRERKL